jgi:diguanylate cyclase (GGDEF)-like protein
VISLKREIEDQTEELLGAMFSAYSAALASVGRNAERAVPGIDFPISSNLAVLSEAMRGNPMPETVARTEHTVDTELSQWSDSVERHLKLKASEFREIMLVMANAAQTLTARDARYGTRFREMTSRLNEIAHINDLSEIRRSLMKSAAELNDDVRNMEVEGQKTIAGLESRLEGYRKQLADAERIGCQDALTGIMNRRGIEAAMTARVEERIPFCLVMFDLNDYKSVNDTYGHLAGDDVLKQFSAELRTHFRPNDLIGRWGGDEFIVVMNGDLVDAGKCVERVRKWAFGDYKIKGGRETHQVQVSASIGIAAWDRQESLEDLISRADRAMYEEKRR